MVGTCAPTRTALDVDSTIDGGGAGGFSGFVADEIVKNIESTYHVPHVRSKVAVTKTNPASNTLSNPQPSNQNLEFCTTNFSSTRAVRWDRWHVQ